MTEINIDYKKAYERQKKARALAEDILENRSRELFEQNESLEIAYTQLKTNKAQLLHQDKLATIGQLAAGVAHEINNPIGYIKSNLHMLANYTVRIKSLFNAYEEMLVSASSLDIQKIQNDIVKINELKQELDIKYLLNDLNDLTQESISGTTRIKEIVSELKSFARRDVGNIQDFQINDCINNVLKLIWNEIKYNSNIDLQLSKTPLLTGLPGEFNQILLNLIINASQAITSSGTIKIITFYDKDNIILQISDNGVGISQENINKIFDPFFTTKEINVGTGLGLSITHGIISKMGGKIEVESVLNQGTTFTLSFPHSNKFDYSILIGDENV